MEDKMNREEEVSTKFPVLWHLGYLTGMIHDLLIFLIVKIYRVLTRLAWGFFELFIRHPIFTIVIMTVILQSSHFQKKRDPLPIKQNRHLTSKKFTREI